MRGSYYLFLGIILILAGAIGLYFAYEASAPGQATLSWIAILVGAFALMVGASRFVSDFMNPHKEEQSLQDQTEVRALVQAMGAMAAADGVIDPKEVNTISSIYERIMGVRISDKEIDEILFDIDDGFDVAGRMKSASSQINQEMKQRIVHSCYLVMVSDLEIDQAEMTKINMIGLALGFSQTEIDEIIAAASV